MESIRKCGPVSQALKYPDSTYSSCQNDPKFTQICTYIVLKSHKFTWTENDTFWGVLMSHGGGSELLPTGFTENKHFGQFYFGPQLEARFLH